MKKIKNIVDKKNKSKIVCLTAYSKNIAEEVDKHVDIILVGDSLGQVIKGEKTTHGVTLDEITYHTKCVKSGLKTSVLIIAVLSSTLPTIVFLHHLRLNFSI